MKSLKSHISFILPLFSIFFALEFYMILDRTIMSYERELVNDYTILVVSKKKLNKDELKPYIDVADLKDIDSNSIIDRLKKENLDLDYEALKTFLPKFYEVKLNHFPSAAELQEIKTKLKEIDGVKRVETFSKTHAKVFKLLLFLKKILNIFIIIIGLLSFLLILKQIKVWHLEHRERMYIMGLFGAPLWMRVGVLVRIAVVDTVFSIFLVYGVFYYFSNLNMIQNVIKFNINIEDIIRDSAILLLAGLFISLFSIISISMRQKEE